MAKVLKPVPASKQKSLGKLPTAVRNKMGFAQDGVFAPITVKKAKLDSVASKRRASIDSTRAAFSRKLDSAKAKINAPKKKAADGATTPKIELRRGQYKRLGRLAAKNPMKAKKVGRRIAERATRTQRGLEYMNKNADKLLPSTPTLRRGGKAKGGMNLGKCRGGCY